MMADHIVCLDSCVLCPPALCDLLLRLAEPPHFYRPIFSQDILDEVTRTQTTKFKRPYTRPKAKKWREAVLAAFPEALVTDYHRLLSQVTNDEKDRHVLAAAIAGQAQYIVTANLKHFRAEDLQPWNITALHPQAFLVSLYKHSPEPIVESLRRTAEDRSAKNRPTTPEQILSTLRKTVPLFVEVVAGDRRWNQA